MAELGAHGQMTLYDNESRTSSTRETTCGHPHTLLIAKVRRVP